MCDMIGNKCNTCNTHTQTHSFSENDPTCRRFMAKTQSMLHVQTLNRHWISTTTPSPGRVMTGRSSLQHTTEEKETRGSSIFQQQSASEIQQVFKSVEVKSERQKNIKNAVISWEAVRRNQRDWGVDLKIQASGRTHRLTNKDAAGKRGKWCNMQKMIQQRGEPWQEGR